MQRRHAIEALAKRGDPEGEHHAPGRRGEREAIERVRSIRARRGVLGERPDNETTASGAVGQSRAVWPLLDVAREHQDPVEDGEVKRRDGPGVRAWLALPIIRDGDCLDVHPNVGVRHDELHALIDRLKGRKTGTEPTLTRMLGDLLPQNTANVTWEFALSDDATWDAQADNLAEHIDLYGRPWMSRYLTLESVLEDLAPHNTDRRAAGLMMLGRVEQARADVDAELAALGGRHDAASDAYRELAQALVADSHRRKPVLYRSAIVNQLEVDGRQAGRPTGERFGHGLG